MCIVYNYYYCINVITQQSSLCLSLLCRDEYILVRLFMTYAIWYFGSNLSNIDTESNKSPQIISSPKTRKTRSDNSICLNLKHAYLQEIEMDTAEMHLLSLSKSRDRCFKKLRKKLILRNTEWNEKIKSRQKLRKIHTI